MNLTTKMMIFAVRTGQKMDDTPLPPDVRELVGPIRPKQIFDPFQNESALQGDTPA